MASKLKKLVDEVKDHERPELDLVDRGIVNILDVPGLRQSIFHNLNLLNI